MFIRAADNNDLARLKELEQLVISYERAFDPSLKTTPTHYYDIPAFIADEDTLLAVVEEGDQIIACGYAQLRRSKEAYTHAQHAYLGFIAVAPTHRGQGINQKLMDKLFEWSRSRGVTDVVFEVYSANESAIKAYRKAGFEPVISQMRLHLD